MQNKGNTKKKFRTTRESSTVLSIFVWLFLGPFASIPLFLVENILIKILVISCLWIIAALPFIYCVTYNAKVKAFKENGQCFSGRIIGIYIQANPRQIDMFRYYLKIHFFEDGDKILCTQAYLDDPNLTLVNSNCNVYKWKGRYLEADFKTLNKAEKSIQTKIPIENPKHLSASEIGKIIEG